MSDWPKLGPIFWWTKFVSAILMVMFHTFQIDFIPRQTECQEESKKKWPNPRRGLPAPRVSLMRNCRQRELKHWRTPTKLGYWTSASSVPSPGCAPCWKELELQQIWGFLFICWLTIPKKLFDSKGFTWRLSTTSLKASSKMSPLPRLTTWSLASCCPTTWWAKFTSTPAIFR